MKISYSCQCAQIPASTIPVISIKLCAFQSKNRGFHIASDMSQTVDTESQGQSAIHHSIGDNIIRISIRSTDINIHIGAVGKSAQAVVHISGWFGHWSNFTCYCDAECAISYFESLVGATNHKSKSYIFIHCQWHATQFTHRISLNITISTETESWRQRSADYSKVCACIASGHLQHCGKGLQHGGNTQAAGLSDPCWYSHVVSP